MSCKTTLTVLEIEEFLKEHSQKDHPSVPSSHAVVEINIISSFYIPWASWMLYKSIFLNSCHACVDCSAMTWNFANYHLTAWLPKLTNFSLVCGFKIKYYLSIQEHVLCMGPLISSSHQSEWRFAANWPIIALKILNYNQTF